MRPPATPYAAPQMPDAADRPFPRDLTLISGPVTLRPLTPDDVPVLIALAEATPEAFANTFTPRTHEQAVAYFGKAFKERADGTAFPFTVLRTDADPPHDRVVGTTRFQELEQAHGRCAIGYTWYAPAHHRDGTNRRCKVLMLDYAFDVLGVRRVQFTTDAGNFASRRSLERLGAVHEGTLRQHRVAADGTVRDSTVYAILVDAWRQVRPFLLPAEGG